MKAHSPRRRVASGGALLLALFCLRVGYAAPVSATVSATVPTVSATVSAPLPGETAFNIKGAGASFTTSLPPSSVATYVWRPGGQTVQEWRTTATSSGLTEALDASPAYPLNDGTDAAAPTITVNNSPSAQKQTIRGFGAAMTDSAAWLLSELPSSGKFSQQQAMNDLFGQSGARLSVIRVPVGASDLINPATTPDGRFSLAHDERYTLPLLAKANALAPDLALIATPWSAPASMKVDGSFNGADCSNLALADARNTLIGGDYKAYADYLVSFVKDYEASPWNLPVRFVSMQNEPENCKNYATMNLTEPDEVRLAGIMRTELNGAHLNGVGVLGFDHNWYRDSSVDSFPKNLASQAGGNVAAIGYHCYDSGGNPDAFRTQLQTTKPEVMMTECTGTGSNSSGVAANLVNEVRDDLMGPIQNHATTSLYWSIAMEPNGEPHATPSQSCQSCRGMLAITVNSTAAKAGNSFTPNQDYYYWAQFSKFVDHNAKVIGSTDLGLGSIETVAFQNPDGSIVVVALNSASSSSYTGHIVQWEGDAKAQKTAWLVGPDGHRRWISNISTYNCLKANGAPGPDVLGTYALNKFPDLNNVWAVCGADRIGVNSMLQQNDYARSANGKYTLKLTASSLTLYPTGNPSDVLWRVGGGSGLVLQGDGNLVVYNGSKAVWASNTVGSGAAWFVVGNDGTLSIYNSAGSYVWNSTRFVGRVVQWEGDTKAQKTAWLVGPDGHRRWINNVPTYNCLKAGGAPGPDVLAAWALNHLPDLTNVWAVCGVDRIGVNSMLQTNFYARSANGAYTLKLTSSSLTLYSTSKPADVRWKVGGGSDLILQADGNLVVYNGSRPVWASNTVGSGAAWLVVMNNGTLALYNGSGAAVWTS